MPYPAQKLVHHVQWLYCVRHNYYDGLPRDHLHNYGPGTRFETSQARIGCVVCVSHLSFRFSSDLECRSAVTVMFVAFPIEAGLVLHSYLMVFHGQVSSGSAGYLPFVRLTGRTSASQQHGRRHWARPPCSAPAKCRKVVSIKSYAATGGRPRTHHTAG